MASGSGFSIVRMMRSERIRLGNDRFQGIKTIKEEITKPSSKMNLRFGFYESNLCD